MSTPLSPEDILQRLKEAGRQLREARDALTPEELAANEAEWAGFRAKVESGCGACAADELSPYEAAKQEQARRKESRGR